MGQFVEENAHLRTNKKAFDEGWDRVFGKKEDKQEVKTTSFKVKDGEIVELAPEEARENVRHPTAGLCGEYGHKTFDKASFDTNFDNIRWEPERMVTKEELEQLKKNVE
jgi:hypothetical protein